MKALLRYLLLLLCISGQQAIAEIILEVTQGKTQAVPIAVVPFEWDKKRYLPENISEIIAADLKHSGYFKPIDENNMRSKPHEEAQVYYKDWKLLGTEYLLVGKIKYLEESQRYQVDYEFFNVHSEKRILIKIKFGNQQRLRDIAHGISDEIYKIVTGVDGAFSTKIIYVVVKDLDTKKTQHRLMLADTDGHREVPLLESSEPIISPSWSPDGKKVAYVSFEGSRPAIYIQEIATGKREKVTSFPGLNGAPAWSPDGQQLAMTLSKDGNPDIYVMNLQTKHLRRITRHLAMDIEPSWSPDGKSIVFTSERGGSGRPQIYQINLETGFKERLTFVGNFNARAHILKDGKSLIVVNRQSGADDFHIAVQDLQKGSLRILTKTFLDESPSIAPNSSMLLYATKHDGRDVLGGVSIDGEITFLLPSPEGDVRDPAWSPFLH